MKNHIWLVAAVLIATMFLPRLVLGGTARHLSFAGHRMIEDPSDVFLFPGLLFAYTGRASLDFEPSANDGQGGLIFGSEKIFGLHANRGLALHNTEGLLRYTLEPPTDYAIYADAPSAIDPAPSFSAPPARMLDVLFGLPTGIGLRLSVANTINTEKKESGDGVKEAGTQFTSLELGAGWSQRRPDRATDISLAVTLNQVKSVSSDLITLESASTPSIAMAGRMAFGMGPGLELGLLGNAHLRNYDVEFPQVEGGGSAERSVFGIIVGVGPRVALTEAVTLAGTVVLGLAKDSSTTKIGDADAVDASAQVLVLPGLDLSIEGWARDWLALRAGFFSRYLITSTESSANKLERSATSRQYEWSAGVGLKFDNFEVDGSFNAPFVTDGPNVLGGKAPGMFAMVSAQYVFGGDAMTPEPSAELPPRPSGPPLYPPGQPRYQPVQPPPPPPPPAPRYEQPSQPYYP